MTCIKAIECLVNGITIWYYAKSKIQFGKASGIMSFTDEAGKIQTIKIEDVVSID